MIEIDGISLPSKIYVLGLNEQHDPLDDCLDGQVVNVGEVIFNKRRVFHLKCATHDGYWFPEEIAMLKYVDYDRAAKLLGFL